MSEKLLMKMNDNYLTIMASVIGVMLVFQVNADIALKWFTTEGYRNLVDTYRSTSNAPEIVKYFLQISSYEAPILYPIQFVFETFAAICLFLGIFRTPMYFLTTGLLALLMIIEFGVPPGWPPSNSGQVNWLWELMLPTLILLVCSIHNLTFFIKSGSLNEKFLGNKIMPSVDKRTKAMLLIIVLSLLSVSIALFSSIPSNVLSKTIVDCLILFLIMILIDRYRCNVSSKT